MGYGAPAGPYGAPGMMPAAYQQPYMPAGPIPVEDGMVISGGELTPASYCDDSACDSCNGGGGGGLFGKLRSGRLGGGLGCASCMGRGCGNCSGMGGFGGGCGPGGCGPDGCGLGAGVGGPLTPLCIFCQGSGCGVCSTNLLGGVAAGVADLLTPYTEAGICAQRWCDFSAEALILKRSGGAADVVVTTQFPADQGGVPVLSTGAVDFDDYEPGLRLTGSLLCHAGTNLEVTYFGLNSWDAQAAVTSDAPNLFSAWSDFGVNPPLGFDDTDRSLSQSLDYESALHSAEVNYRKRWVGPYCRFQGSWLAGIRYFDLDEALIYSTRGEFNNGTGNFLRFSDTQVRTRNALTGVQIGGDLWWNIYPGINLGVEAKGGIFGNRAEQDTTFVANSVDFLTEGASSSKTAYVGELALTSIYRLSYSWSVRSSLFLLSVDNVALAPNNLNFDGPVGFFAPPVGQRLTVVDINDSVTYTGYSIGAEYIW
jgi:hypothetical protein